MKKGETPGVQPVKTYNLRSSAQIQNQDSISRTANSSSTNTPHSDQATLHSTISATSHPEIDNQLASLDATTILPLLQNQSITRDATPTRLLVGSQSLLTVDKQFNNTKSTLTTVVPELLPVIQLQPVVGIELKDSATHSGE